MGTRGLLYLFVLLLPLVANAEARHASISKVIDGDTVILDDGERVRLLDINAPELPHDGAPAEPGSTAARDFLRQLAEGKTARLEIGNKKRDTYNRLLAHIYLDDGTWLNGDLVAHGMAHVYTFADNAALADKLLPLEASARAQKMGIWAQPRWAVRDASTCCTAADIGLFMLVQGKIKHAAVVKDRVYFNFGDDWHTDFSFFIARKDNKWFSKAGIPNPALYYAGKTVRVHGHLQPVNGVLVRVTHPAQIETLE